jgi:hypothetical protein
MSFHYIEEANNHLILITDQFAVSEAQNKLSNHQLVMNKERNAENQLRLHNMNGENHKLRSEIDELKQKINRLEELEQLKGLSNSIQQAAINAKNPESSETLSATIAEQNQQIANLKAQLQTTKKQIQSLTSIIKTQYEAQKSAAEEIVANKPKPNKHAKSSMEETLKQLHQKALTPSLSTAPTSNALYKQFFPSHISAVTHQTQISSGGPDNDLETLQRFTMRYLDSLPAEQLNEVLNGKWFSPDAEGEQVEVEEDEEASHPNDLGTIYCPAYWPRRFQFGVKSLVSRVYPQYYQSNQNTSSNEA